MPRRPYRRTVRPAPTLESLKADLEYALDPVKFAVERLNFQPDPWQERLLRSTEPRVILNCSRQSGKSTTTAILALHRVVYHPDELVLLISPTQRQSKELFAKAIAFLRRLEPAEVLEEDNRLSCTLANGARLVSLPGDQRTIRGYSGPSLIIEDEAARVPDETYQAIRPMLAVSGGRLILMSTPFGRKGHFHDAWHGASPGWLKIFLPASECPRITPEFLDDELRVMGPLVYGQEYQCAFSDNVTQLFPTDMIMRALTRDFPPFFENLHHAPAAVRRRAA
jgi:hypothetical protein